MAVLLSMLEKKERDNVNMDTRLWKNENYWVSGYNFDPETVAGHHISDNLKIHDATLRDGEQTPGVVLRKEEKVRIAQLLDEAGVQRIEAGMPAVSDEDKLAIAEIKRRGLKAEIFGFVRALESDLILCKECGVDGIVLEVPIGRPKLELQFKWDIRRVIDSSVASIRKARELGLKVIYFPYDTTRADEDDLDLLLDSLRGDARPDAIGLVDTMGCALPGAVATMMRYIRERTGGLPIEIHTHNDFGLAVASTLQAVLCGADTVHCCVNGLGERTGNCSLEEIVCVIQILLGKDLGIDLSKLQGLSDYVAEKSGIPVMRNKPIVGKDIFARESGIGADTLFSAPLAMFALNPAFLGKQPRLILGKKSGMLSIGKKLELLGVTLDDDRKRALLGDVKALGIQKERALTDEEFLALLRNYQ